jgi:hypothetical protein
MLRTALALFGGAWFVCGLTSAQTVFRLEYLVARDNLRTIEAPLRVVVDSFEEDLALQTDVELRLRRAGIEVGDQTPFTLGVHLSSYPLRDSARTLVLVIVQLSTFAVVGFGDSADDAMVTIWDSVGLGSCPQAACEEVRTTVRDLVDQFINDYLATHPTP